MSDWTAQIMFVTVACAAFAVGVWLFVRTERRADRTESAATGSESCRTRERRRMQAGDWFNAVVSLLVGVLLGSVVDGLVQLVAAGLWQSAMIITLVFGALFLFMWVFDKVTDPLFSIGVRPAPKPQAKGRTPLLRLLSLPAGLLLGVVSARLGLDAQILGMIP